MNNLIILSGPTGVGKTEISIDLAKKVNGEIISCDSMQIYKLMDIGSAKITNEESKGVPHHLIDIVSPDESFNVSDYKELAEAKIEYIEANGKLPILVGGTGLYINSLLYDFNFNDSDVDDSYRAYLNALLHREGRDFIHSMLEKVDPLSYKKLNPNDFKRVTRALEVFYNHNKTVHELKKSSKPKYNYIYFVLNVSREKLYEQINARVDNMLHKGLLEEVIKLKEMGYNTSYQSMQGIGYKELLNYLEGKINYTEAVELIKKGSRNYAKRQLTWFRRQPDAIWIDKDNFQAQEEIVDYMLKQIKSKL